MFLIRHCLLFSLFFVLPGCAYIHSLDENLPRQIDTWINNKDYGKALDTLYYIQPDNNNYKQLMIQREKIVQLAQEFEQEILQDGSKSLQAKNWHRAYETYDYGLEKLPDSRAIRKAQTEFLAKRAAYLKQLKLKLLQNKTKWLLSDTEIRNEVARVIPKNYSAHWLLQDHNLDIDTTSKTLLECVTDSIATNELDVARQCLNIVKQLTPSQPIQNNIIEASKHLEQEIQIRSRKLSPHGVQTLRTAKVALAKGDFQTAHHAINSLPEQDKNNGKVIIFKNGLDDQTEDYVDKTILEGRRLYSAGKVQQAYLLWKSLKPLSPDNQRLQTLIERAEKVLKKLHEIGNKQDVVTPPASQ